MPDNKQDRNDPDTRFLLANERTLLAWIRTSLTIQAGGVALAQIHKQHNYVGVVVILLGGFVALIGYSRYREADRAIRAGRLPRNGHGPGIEVFLIVGVAIILAIAELTFLHN